MQNESVVLNFESAFNYYDDFLNLNKTIFPLKK